MGRIRALPLLLGAIAASGMVSGASGADPSTPAALPGRPAPFLGTAVVGSGRLLAAVDAYGDVVDLRVPGPAGEAQVFNPFARQAAGSVPPGTGMVPSLATDGGPPLKLWRAEAMSQSYLRNTNVLRTSARVGGATIRIEDAAAGQQLTRRIAVRGRPAQPLVLRLGVNFDLGGEIQGDSLSAGSSGFVQRDGSRSARCLATPAGHLEGSAGGGAIELRWRGRGLIRAQIDCAFGAQPQPGARLIREAAAGDRSWLGRTRPLGPRAPAWARRLHARSLLVLRALTDRASGASVAGARDRWAYVWPRDAGAAALALAVSGHRADARRIARFLTRLDLDAGARFRGDTSPVADGRALPGDGVGWVRAAALAAGLPAPHPGAWRDRGDYGERDDDRGDYLANAIAGGAGTAEIRRLFATRAGLHRRAGDQGSGLDTAAAWAVEPFARPALFALVRRSLLALEARAGRYGIAPSQDWPRPQAWTAPAAWSAWSLAELGNRDAALRLIAALRRASTPAGAIPERAGPGDGLPRSTTPLAWSHSFLVLALRSLYGE
jgi:glucoamylase